MPQLLLPYPIPVSYDHTVFMETASNHQALHYITNYEHWQTQGFILIGPQGCGKTHLAHIWQRLSNARFITHDDVVSLHRSMIIQNQSALIIDGIEKYSHYSHEFFHILNEIILYRKPVFLTASAVPDQTMFPLNDILSRLHLFPAIMIDAPDDDLFKAVMIKRFAELQLMVDDKIIDYILQRAERSFTTLHSIIEKLYNHCLTQKQKPSFTLLRQII